MNVTMGTVLGITPEDVNVQKLCECTWDTNPANRSISVVLSSVYCGIQCTINSMKLNYHHILGFFAGKRFVPIVTAATALILGLLMIIDLAANSKWSKCIFTKHGDANLTLSAFIFGVIERSLIPFGLHHIFYAPFWYEFGVIQMRRRSSSW